MAHYKIVKVDRRYNGHQMFKYIIDFAHGANGYADRINGLSDARDWCWQTWGSSNEIEYVYLVKKHSTWSWQTSHNQLRIYLQGDQELTLFKLKF